MKRAILISLLLLLAGCAGHNAYRAKKDGFGYTGEFPEYAQKGNQGFVCFVGGEDITPERMKRNTLRRIAELCREKGYDYFAATPDRPFATTGLEQRSRYMGKSADAYGNVWARYQVWKEKVGAKGQRTSFLAWRGPMPAAGRYHSVREVLREMGGPIDALTSAGGQGEFKCESCGAAVESVNQPERCPSCGKDVIASVLCPHCDAPNPGSREGAAVCGKCGAGFRVAFCPACGGRHTLRDFRPFECSFCGTQVGARPRLAADEFACPHCAWVMRWPAELFGEYRCEGCRRIFTVRRCPKCQAPNAEATPDALSCESCGHKIRPPRPK